MILNDEALKSKEEESYKIWEKEGGNSGVIRRKLIAQAQDQDTMRQMIEWGEEHCPHIELGRGYDVMRHECETCWQELKAGVK